MSFEVRWRRIDEVIEDVIDRRGITPLKLGGDFVERGHRVISAKLIKNGRIVLDADVPRFVDASVYSKWMKTPLRVGDVIMTSEAPLGELAYLGRDKDWCLGQRLFALRPRQGVIDGRFLYYALQTNRVRDDIFGRATGTTVQGIRQAELRKVKIPVPSLSDQIQASSILGALDDRITILREANATLEEIAQALFKSWFVDFDPVRAKQGGRAPEGMDNATAALFPDGFDESKLGPVPSGWRLASIEEVVEGVYDGPHATPPEADTGPIFLGIKNLTGSGIDLTAVRHIHEDQWVQWTRRVVPSHGDIVFSYEATLGFFALIPPATRCCLGRRLALIRPRARNGYGHFWFHQFVAAPFQRLLEKHTIQGATVNRIALKHFPSYAVLNPPDSIKRAFETVVEPIWARIHENQAQCKSLVGIRDTLLPRLISGELLLPEAADQTALAA
ncbi:type I restriction enzyme S subunit [Massilia sp. MP_M2]|uniref:restriction endonuclease subunit S n=1 Tax=Massilia sp. MP_M2 TaxID=3071713 RepID=UPI00319DF5C6